MLFRQQCIQLFNFLPRLFKDMGNAQAWIIDVLKVTVQYICTKLETK